MQNRTFWVKGFFFLAFCLLSSGVFAQNNAGLKSSVQAEVVPDESPLDKQAEMSVSERRIDKALEAKVNALKVQVIQAHTTGTSKLKVSLADAIDFLINSGKLTEEEIEMFRGML